MEFIKAREYFIGIDSDGTVFDSMKIKHTDSFIPAAIEIFDLQECKDAYKEAAERINLYSLKRGINRFPGLYLALLEMKEKGLWIDEVEELGKYVDSGYPLSNDGLEKWLSEQPSDFMQKVLVWSRLGDAYFEKLTKSIQPFEGVTKIVAYMGRYADIMVVSAASGKGLKKDWGNAGLVEKVNFIAGQELGSKEKQLSFAAEQGFEGTKMLMIGDALGDYKAAKAVGAWFYPVIPGQESRCWNMLHEKYFDMFVTNRYDKLVENELYEAFIDTLKAGQ